MHFLNKSNFLLLVANTQFWFHFELLLVFVFHHFFAQKMKQVAIENVTRAEILKILITLSQKRIIIFEEGVFHSSTFFFSHLGNVSIHSQPYHQLPF